MWMSRITIYITKYCMLGNYCSIYSSSKTGILGKQEAIGTIFLDLWLSGGVVVVVALSFSEVYDV